jgi:hypothetical protein
MLTKGMEMDIEVEVMGIIKVETDTEEDKDNSIEDVIEAIITSLIARRKTT